MFCVPDGMEGEEELVRALNEGEDQTATQEGIVVLIELVLKVVFRDGRR